MPSQIGWRHPIDDADQWDGFNEPGIEHFAGSPIRHLAREVNQNACDAREADAGSVIVKICRRDVLTSEIPSIDELRTNLKSCCEASAKESKKSSIFFENALNELEKKKISVLEISDFNTRGMKGPSTNGTPFYAFMKAKGQSRKEDEAASGSYGIGKFAPYAVSKIRTIFISTVFQDDSGEFQQLTQGKSILMSHDQDGQRKQGIGFWGAKEKCQPVIGVSKELPKWIQRENSALSKRSQGSKLTVLCFDAVKNWEEHLAASVAENFFGAILKGDLRVEIEDKYTLDQTTINEFFENDTIRASIIEDEKLKQFDNCKHYLAALRGGTEVIIEESERSELGMCQVRILIGDKLPKRVCVLRNGMFITDSLIGLKSFYDFKDFVAVFHCQSTKGNELLRAMEPPRHDDFEPDRLPTKDEQKKGQKALKGLSTWIRDMLKRHAKDPVSEVTEIDELKDFFGDEGDADSGKGTEEINPYGDVKITAKPIRPKVASTENYGSINDNANDEGGDDDVSGGGKGATGTKGGSNSSDRDKGEESTGHTSNPDASGNTGGSGNSTGGGVQKSLVDINNVRAILNGTRTRKLAFTPVKSGKIAVHLKEAGADSDYDISIIKSDKGDITNGGIILDVEAGRRVSLDIELNQDFSGALKAVVYEV
jgi:hypothetical protein